MSTTPTPPLGLVEKSRVLLAAGSAIVLFTTVGWAVAEPEDPDMGVTLVVNWGRVLSVWPALTALTAVAAVIGTVLAPRRLVEGGVFAAAVGLAGLALKGGSMQDLLGYVGTATAEGRRALMARLALDTLLWTAVLLAAWVVVAVVRRWLWADDRMYSSMPFTGSTEGESAPGAVAAEGPATPAGVQPPGWPATIVTGLVAVFFIYLTVARTPIAMVARGQVIFSVGMGFYLGAMAGRYFTGVARSHWYLLAVPAAALLGYLIGYLNAGLGWAVGAWKPFADLATTPPHALVRPLPIEYLAVGVTATLIGFWSGEKMEHVTEPGTKA
ncbi:MAG: hypothetical protein HRF43_04340 [Phycisphaerae bacterium]